MTIVPEVEIPVFYMIWMNMVRKSELALIFSGIIVFVFILIISFTFNR